MKWALLSDIHGNWTAWKACVAHARLQGVTRWAILGDLVGYGPHPGEIVDAVRELQASTGAVVLRGNHEELALRGAKGESMGALTAVWTHQQLSPEQKQWLADLPLTHVDAPLMLVHASADAPERWHYVEDARGATRSLDAALRHNTDVRYVIGGHVHHQTLYYRGKGQQLMPFKPKAGVPVPVPAHRHWLATIGSVGQPRDGDTRAAYAIFDLDRKEMCFHRVGYDHGVTARAIRDAGLPELLASRLESGT